MTSATFDLADPRGGRGADALWVQVEAGLHVGNDRGRYLGSIEVDGDLFVAYGADAQFLGRFPRIEDAKGAAARQVEAPAGRRRRRRPRSLRDVYVFQPDILRKNRLP